MARLFFPVVSMLVVKLNKVFFGRTFCLEVIGNREWFCTIICAFYYSVDTTYYMGGEQLMIPSLTQSTI